MAKRFTNWKRGAQVSPYELIGRKKMEQIKDPKPQGHVKGCGDPNCKICLPDGDPAAAGGAKLGGPIPSFYVEWSVDARADPDARVAFTTIDPRQSTSFQDFNDRVIDEMRQRVIRDLDSQFGMPPRSVNRPSNNSAAIQRERQLRANVKQYIIQTRHSIAWEDVIGNDEARRALIEAIEHPIKHAEIYRHYKKQPTKGVLLYGPPGCGKTMFGKAAASVVAKMFNVSDDAGIMLKINGPEIQTCYVGQTEAVIRAVFEYARAYKAAYGFPLVLFIDEADAILPNRDGIGGRPALPWEQTQVAQFLTELDGIEGNGAFVILATNRPFAIDPAVLRDGRCDRKIRVERPTRDAAAQIFANALREVPLMGGAPSDALAGAAAIALFADQLKLFEFATDKGQHALTLGHIVNGAMVVGIVEQAKANAFARDIAAGGAPSGICLADIEAAIATKLKENMGADHSVALTEQLQAIGASTISPVPVQEQPDTRPSRLN